MFRRVILALVSLALLCGPAAAAEKFIVASDCTWPPMEMLDANKQPEGFSTDYLRAMGKAAGFEVEVRNIAWDGIFGGVATGQYDIVASSVTITPERQQQFDFSAPYYEGVQAGVLPAGKLNISFKAEEKEYYGFTVRKGRKDLVEKLNKGIAAVKASGEDRKIAEKWLGK